MAVRLQIVKHIREMPDEIHFSVWPCATNRARIKNIPGERAVTVFRGIARATAQIQHASNGNAFRHREIHAPGAGAKISCLF
jgi:hypothetical protein